MSDIKKTNDFTKRKLEDVVSVYSGKPGCMCGCLGIYKYSSIHQEYASENRGYKVEESEISDIAVKRMFNKFAKNLDQVKQYKGIDYIYFIDTDTRTNVIYFKKTN
jgi:hypothetical protein